MSEHVFERFLRMPFKRAYVVGPCLGYRHWMEFQLSFLWWWGNLEDGSHKLMKLEQRHTWNLGSYDGDSPGLLVFEPHDVIYEKTNAQFCKGTLCLGQFVPTGTDFQSRSGSLQWPTRALSEGPPPPSRSSDLVSYHSLPHLLYSSPMASSLCVSGALQPPRLCTCCSPYLEPYCLKCLPSKCFPILQALTQNPLPSASSLVSLSL